MQRNFPLLGLLLLSLILNTIGIVRWNAGAPYDTAHKGIETIEEVLQGNLAPFYRHYNGQPPLMDWILTPLFLFVGVSAVTLHVMGIVMGVITTWLLYVAGSLLWNKRAGVYASLLGTTSHWLLQEVREGTHNIPLVPMLLGVLICMVLVFTSEKRRVRYWAAMGAGTLSGLLGYVYAAGWIFPLFFAVFFPLLLALTLFKSSWKYQRFPLLIVIVLMAGILFPFVRFAFNDPHSVTIHADDEVRTREPGELQRRAIANLVPTAGAFTYLIFPPFNDWESNGSVSWASLSVPFPVPLVSPVGGLLLVVSVVLVGWGWYKKRSMFIPAILFFFLLLALFPNLITAGQQPHYRRAVCAMVPLFLLIGWSASVIHEYVRKKRGWYVGWLIVMLFGVLYGPVVYFMAATTSQWFADTYITKHDRVAPYLFARVQQGQRVVLVGNGAHLKSFQFYALATSQAQKAFTLFDRLQDDSIPQSVLDEADVLVYIYPTCDSFSFSGFVSPYVVRSRFGVDGCIFDRIGASSENRYSTVPLPVSPPLWSAFWNALPPLEKHQPLHGPIYGI